MELFRNPRIDFLGKRNLFAAISLAAVLGSAGLLATRGLTYGIDFRGGADLVLRFAEPPAIDEIRRVLNSSGFDGAQIQELLGGADAAAHDLLIRVPPREEAAGTLEEQGDVSGQVLSTLRSGLMGEARGGLDLNMSGETEFRRLLQEAFPGRDEMVAQAARALVTHRNSHAGLLRSTDELSAVAGLPPDVLSWLKSNATVGRFAIRSVDYVGPSVGKELRSRATYAILGSLAAMLIYIWFRFEKLAFGVSAILTLAHDALIALGAVSLTGKEFDLTVLAAILTIVGYSINDTIVIFDRIRENLHHRRGDNMIRLCNDSVNQTLSRTILTTALVLVTVLTLWLFGGSRLNPFSFTLLVGCISGSYSTIYVSCPIVIWWRQFVEKKAA